MKTSTSEYDSQGEMPASGSLTLADKLEDCEVGVAKEITLRVMPTSNDEDGFKADVQEVVGYEHPGEGDSEKMPMRKEMKGMAPAVAVVIAGKRT